MTGCTVRRYKQIETSPETIEQELQPAVCEHRQTDIRRIIVDVTNTMICDAATTVLSVLQTHGSNLPQLKVGGEEKDKRRVTPRDEGLSNVTPTEAYTHTT